MIKQGEAIKGFFPATAMPDADWWEALWPHPAKVLADLGIEPSMEVVDLCCGDGLFTAPLALMSRRVIGIDIDPGMLSVARAKIAAAGATNHELIEGDAYAVAQLVRRPVDYVLIANTFHGVPNKPQLARAVATILKPGGRFAIVNWHRRQRDETTVLGQPRGPKTEMRMSPADWWHRLRRQGSAFPALSNCRPITTARFSRNQPCRKPQSSEWRVQWTTRKTSICNRKGRKAAVRWPWAWGWQRK